MSEEHHESAVDDELSDLLVRLIQVLLAFILGQSLIQNQEILIDPQERGNWIAGLALLAVVVYAAESWIDWHVDVARHPFMVGGRNRFRRWGLTRLWADLAHVAVVAYLALTVDHVIGDPDASLTRHLVGYVAVYALMTVAIVARDVTHGTHRSMRAIALVTTAVMAGVVVIYRVTVAGADERELGNLAVLVAVMVVNGIHHARFRALRGLT